MNRHESGIEVKDSNPRIDIAYIDPLGRGRTKEAQANARLIAAAPELLEAAEELSHEFVANDRQRPGLLGDRVRALRAAINKATT